MCGIAGWFGRPESGDADALKQGIIRRGPDGSGIWQSEKATFVHTRLAVLDPSDLGAQPMVWQRNQEGQSLEQNLGESMDSQLGFSNGVIVFNGEIYNFGELRSRLQAQGEVFTSKSDTEVLLRLLVREGADMLPRLAGMFAFAFWNPQTGEGMLARDAFGIKPLYYRHDGKTLSFSSESRSLYRAGDRADPDAVRDFFLWGSVPETQTFWGAVRQLPAGSLLRWRDGRLAVEKWYRPPFSASDTRRDSHYPRQRAVRTTRRALEESIERHLVSDVPVGVFLSGGIDSTAVLALMRHMLGKEADIRTFSIGFDDPVYDESSLARRTAEHFETSHTEWKMSSADGVAEISTFLEAVDQPSIDGFNTWCVSKLARREGIKVVLSGLGGDEWFAGYGSFQRVPVFARWYRGLGPLRKVVGRILYQRLLGHRLRRLGAFLRGGGSWLEAFHAQRGIFVPEEAALLAESLTGEKPRPCSWDIEDLPESAPEIVSWLEISHYMRNQLLRDSDVFSMAHGLELRVPFVDSRLAETLLAIPHDLRLRQGKGLLIEAVPEIPEWIRDQPKRGFRFPFQEWMEDSFSDMLSLAGEAAPVALQQWYRTWAVAAARRAIEV